MSWEWPTNCTGQATQADLRASGDAAYRCWLFCKSQFQKPDRQYITAVTNLLPNISESFWAAQVVTKATRKPGMYKTSRCVYIQASVT